MVRIVEVAKYDFQKKRIEALEKEIQELREELDYAFPREEPELRHQISIRQEMIEIIKG